jgi:ketosteroid isomerase-like protein
VTDRMRVASGTSGYQMKTSRSLRCVLGGHQKRRAKAWAVGFGGPVSFYGSSGPPERDTAWAMSKENVEIVRRNYEVINSIGRTGEEFVDPEIFAPDLWARLAPEFELHERPDLPDAKVYRGREASKEFWRKTQQLFAQIRWEPVEIVDLDHVIVATTKITLIGRGSEVPLEADETDLFWFREGVIVRVQGFATMTEALAAAGAAGVGVD